jgi:hypothetical protein
MGKRGGMGYIILFIFIISWVVNGWLFSFIVEGQMGGIGYLYKNSPFVLTNFNWGGGGVLLFYFVSLFLFFMDCKKFMNFLKPLKVVKGR